MDIIRVENLKLHYSLEAGIKKAIDDITLEIKRDLQLLQVHQEAGSHLLYK